MLIAHVQIGGPLALRDKLVAFVCEMLYQSALAEYQLYPDLPSPLGMGVPYVTTPCDETTCVDQSSVSPTGAMTVQGWDCKSIAAARRAYLKVRKGIDTKFVIERHTLPTGDIEYHITLEGTSGKWRGMREDTSRMLGM